MKIRSIIGFTGYFISNDGRVFCNLGKGNRNKTTKLYEIKPRPTKNGYLRVCMRSDTTHERVDVYVHRLVAEYYIHNDDPYNKNEVHHLDYNVSNNHDYNLEWVTHKENLEYTINDNRLNHDADGQFTGFIVLKRKHSK